MWMKLRFCSSGGGRGRGFVRIKKEGEGVQKEKRRKRLDKGDEEEERRGSELFYLYFLLTLWDIIKDVNITYGHEHGHEKRIKIAQRVMIAFPTKFTLYRQRDR